MEKTLIAAIAVSGLMVVGLSACTPEKTALSNAPGTYERTTSSTDAKGTTTQRQSSTDVSVDKDGNKKAVITSKTTKDPKGLLNKTTTSESTQTLEEK